MTIQNFIQFPKFGVKFETENSGAPECSYNPITSKHCPYFKLGDIVEYSYDNSKSFDEIARSTGAIFEIKIEWNCSLNEVCKPEFSFWRRDLDNPKSHFWSFWSFEKLNPNQRVLTYGMKIKFYVTTVGYMKTFSLFNLATELAAYSAIYAVAMALMKCCVRIFSDVDKDQKFVYCRLMQKFKNLVLHRKFAYNEEMTNETLFVLSTIRSEDSNGIRQETSVEIRNPGFEK